MRVPGMSEAVVSCCLGKGYWRTPALRPAQVVAVTEGTQVTVIKQMQDSLGKADSKVRLLLGSIRGQCVPACLPHRG